MSCRSLNGFFGTQRGKCEALTQRAPSSGLQAYPGARTLVELIRVRKLSEGQPQPKEEGSQNSRATITKVTVGWTVTNEKRG